jgi:hypothetical protein
MSDGPAQVFAASRLRGVRQPDRQAGRLRAYAAASSSAPTYSGTYRDYRRRSIEFIELETDGSIDTWRLHANEDQCGPIATLSLNCGARTTGATAFPRTLERA